MDLLTILSRTFFDFPSMMEVLPQMLTTGLVNTVIISLAATLLGTLFGLLLALMGISPSRWLRLPARLYTDLFRGLPSILTILLIGQAWRASAISCSVLRPIRWGSSPLA